MPARGPARLPRGAGRDVRPVQGGSVVPQRVAGALGADVYPDLYADLTERPERVAPFFPLAPGSPDAWRRRASTLDLAWSGQDGQRRRAAIAAALHALQLRLGAQPAQLANLDHLAQPGTVAVVSGQQPGLLGGPLYTLYKALGTVVRAAQVRSALGRPVVPVFWVASEEHDWGEVSRADVIGPDGSPHVLRLPGMGDARSAGHAALPPEVRRLVGQLLSLHPPRGRGAAVADGLLATLRGPGRMSLARWFTAQMQFLLGSTGLLLFDPMDPAIRALAAPIFAGVAGRAAAANAAILDAASRLIAAGYAPGLSLDPDHLHLFTYIDGRRVALHVQDGRIRTKAGRVDWSAAQLADHVVADPTAFSPNVALRPVVQDATLPVLCQLAGPGEVAYLAQVSSIYPLWDRAVPIVAPRPGLTLVLPQDREVLRDSGVPLLDLWRDAPAALDRAAERRAGVDIAAIFAPARSRVEEEYGTLLASLGAVDQSLPRLGEQNRQRVLYQLQYLERKAHQHQRRAQRAVVSGLRAASGRLFPRGGLQERANIAYPYLFSYGVEWVDQLASALAETDAPFGRHLVLELEDS
jgi:bacillithiol biosynthesis cysteine-adding enzyme BshC